MKKGLLAGAALALALTAPMAVFAEEAASSTAEDAKIIIEERSENDGIKVGDAASVVNAKWGTSIASDYVVVFVGEAYVTPAGAKDITLTVKAADFNKGEIFVHHKKDGSNDVGATVTLNSNDLSPVVTLAKAAGGKTSGGDSTVNTGDRNNTGLWAGALLISALLAGAAVIMNKRSD